jgi:Zn-dependent protease with chaperone function
MHLRDKIEHLENPEFDALAKKMQVGERLRKKNPYVLSSKLWLNVEARVDFKPKVHIIFSKDLYEKLTPEERLAAAAHEFAHIREGHYVEYYNRLIFNIMLYAPMLIVILPLGYLVYAMFAIGPSFLWSTASLFTLGLLLIAIVFTLGMLNRRRSRTWENLEISADRIAANFVDPRSIASVLLKIDRLRSEAHVPFNKRISLFLEKDHPEVEIRIRELCAVSTCE